MLNARVWAKLGLKSHALEIDELNDATERLNKLVGEADTDPEANDQAVALISKLQNPIHSMVTSWNDWWLAHNSLGYPTTWDPASNPA
jgi:hypothetical protein